MGRSRHTEAQIIAALKQVEAGRTVDDVARECGVGQATIYTWKSKFGGMEVSERSSCVLEYNEQRPHSSLGYRTPAEFARVARTRSYGKDVGFAHMENAPGVFRFPTAPAAG